MWRASSRAFASRPALLREPDYRSMLRSILQRAGKASELPENFIGSLGQCDFTLKMQIPIRMDDGTVASFPAFRAHHSTYTLPVKGGVRFSPSTTMEVAESMAMLNTLKLAVVDLPFGGAGGGVQVDPTELSRNEFDQLLRRYSEYLFTREMMGPAIDVPGPEVGANGWTMAVMMDTYRSHMTNDVNSLGAVTGKPVQIGGIRGRAEAAGTGSYLAMREFCKDAGLMSTTGLKPGLSEKSYILAGFGNVGSTIANLLFKNEKNARVIAVVERDGCTYNPDGLDIPALTTHFHRHQTVKGFNGGQTFNKCREILGKQCDVLISANCEQYINATNVAGLNCKVLVESANSAVTEYAEGVLKGKGVVILPDIILNTGSMTVSYLEYVKNLGHIKLGRLTKRWQERSAARLYDLLSKVSGKAHSLEHIKGADELDLVTGCLEDVMTESVAKTVETATKLKLDFRMAGWVNALHSIYEKKKFIH